MADFLLDDSMNSPFVLKRDGLIVPDNCHDLNKSTCGQSPIDLTALDYVDIENNPSNTMSFDYRSASPKVNANLFQFANNLSSINYEESPIERREETPGPGPLNLGSPSSFAEEEEDDEEGERTGTPQLTESEKRRREEEESERLAYELMREEQEELYRMQMEFIQAQAQTLSEEDYRALQLVLNENGHGQAAEEEDQNEEQEEGEEQEEDEEDEEQVDGNDYDRLLALGQALGDVKTERWRMRSNQVVSTLPTCSYAHILKKKKQQQKQSQATSTSQPIDLTITPDPKKNKPNQTPQQTPSHPTVDLVSPTEETSQLSLLSPMEETHEVQSLIPRYHEYRCIVCMENYELTDMLNVLPCQHYFHIDCAKGWLLDHNACPLCKVKITSSP